MKKQINSSLPIVVEVCNKDLTGRYTLLLNKIKLSSRSQIPLEIGAKYLAQLSMDKGRLSFNTLQKIPSIYPFAEGLELFQKVLQSSDLSWFVSFISKGMLLASKAFEFNHFKTMLFAYLKGVLHLPFLLENKPCLAQIKQEKSKLFFYLFIQPFGPLLFIKDKNTKTIFTPFSKVASLLINKGLNAKLQKEVKPLFTNILDYQG